MAVSVFCPSYATGIFSIGERDSAGAGFAIDAGLTTTVAASKKGRMEIRINGAETPAPVSKAVLRRFVEKGCKIGLLEINHKTDVPIGFGMGMSAAGALSLSLALNELLGTGIAREECVKIAHDADVECGTGLSGVDAAAIGGALVRATVESRPVKIEIEEREIHLAFFSAIKTASVIRSDEWKGRVNAAGGPALARLAKEKAWDSFIEESRKFAYESGLGEWCAPHMRHNTRASMAMLGHTLFSDAPYIHLGTPMKLMKAKICDDGAKLV